jgi:hypothetical protein
MDLEKKSRYRAFLEAFFPGNPRKSLKMGEMRGFGWIVPYACESSQALARVAT